MSKNLFAVALFCLHVIPVNTYAAEATSADIDSLVQEARPATEAEIRAKIVENQKLTLELAKVQNDLENMQKDIAENRHYVKKDLIIAGGTALGSAILSYYFRSQTGRSEMADSLNIMFSVASILVGGSITVMNAGKAGIHYLVLRLDEKKIPALQAKVAELQKQLEDQTKTLLR